MVCILINGNSAAGRAALSFFQRKICEPVVFKTGQAFFSAEPDIALIVLMDIPDPRRNQSIFLSEACELPILVAGKPASAVTNP